MTYAEQHLSEAADIIKRLDLAAIESTVDLLAGLRSRHGRLFLLGVGGKLVGAGTGGFLMFYATDPTALRAAMAAENLQETRFAFDLDGSTVIVRD